MYGRPPLHRRDAANPPEGAVRHHGGGRHQPRKRGQLPGRAGGPIGYSGRLPAQQQRRHPGSQGGPSLRPRADPAWDPVNSRSISATIGPNDLHYDVVNQTTGAVSSSGSSRTSNGYSSAAARVSVAARASCSAPGTVSQNLTWSSTLGASRPTHAGWPMALVTLATTAARRSSRG